MIKVDRATEDFRLNVLTNLRMWIFVLEKNPIYILKGQVVKTIWSHLISFHKGVISVRFAKNAELKVIGFFYNRYISHIISGRNAMIYLILQFLTLNHTVT